MVKLGEQATDTSASVEVLLALLDNANRIIVELHNINIHLNTIQNILAIADQQVVSKFVLWKS